MRFIALAVMLLTVTFLAPSTLAIPSSNGPAAEQALTEKSQIEDQLSSTPERLPGAPAFQPGSDTGGAGRGTPLPPNIYHVVCPAKCSFPSGVCACVADDGGCCNWKTCAEPLCI